MAVTILIHPFLKKPKENTCKHLLGLYWTFYCPPNSSFTYRMTSTVCPFLLAISSVCALRILFRLLSDESKLILGFLNLPE